VPLIASQKENLAIRLHKLFGRPLNKKSLANSPLLVLKCKTKNVKLWNPAVLSFEF